MQIFKKKDVLFLFLLKSYLLSFIGIESLYLKFCGVLSIISLNSSSITSFGYLESEIKYNKDQNVHRFAVRGELLERERSWPSWQVVTGKRERDKERKKSIYDRKSISQKAWQNKRYPKVNSCFVEIRRRGESKKKLS